MVSMHTRHPNRWPALFTRALDGPPGSTHILGYGESEEAMMKVRAKFLVFKKSLREHPKLPPPYRELGARRSRCTIGFNPISQEWYAAVTWTDWNGERSPSPLAQPPEGEKNLPAGG
jgi:hypothetical protein